MWGGSSTLSTSPNSAFSRFAWGPRDARLETRGPGAAQLRPVTGSELDNPPSTGMAWPLT
jgi:hypothetical protein